MNQSIVAGTLVALYEVSIWLALIFQKRRPKSEFDQFMDDEGDYAPDAADNDDGTAGTGGVEASPPPKNYEDRDG